MAEPTVSERVENLERKVDVLALLPARVTAVEVQLVQLRDEMRGECSATRREFRASIDGLREELVARMTEGDEETRRELRNEMHAMRDELVTRIIEGDEETRREMHEALAAQTQRLERRIADGDEETRRFMRVLHEDVISRIATIQEGHRPRRKR